MPFDWQTPLSYAISWFLQSAAVFSMMVFIAPMLSWLVGTCWLFIWLIDDITCELSRLNPINASNQRESKLNKRFFRIVQLHSDVNQLSVAIFEVFPLEAFSPRFRVHTKCIFLLRFVNDFNSIVEFITLSTFLWSISTVASSLLLFLGQLVE